MKKAEAISILATSVRPREAKDRARYDEAVKMAIEALKSSEQTAESAQNVQDEDLISKLSEIRSEYNCFDEDGEPQYRALSEAIRILSQLADGDTISRQAAIDALARMMPRSYTPDGSHPADEEIFMAQEVFADCIEALEILPSAAPSTAHTTETAAPSTDDWIPVGKRLPAVPVCRCLITRDDGRGRVTVEEALFSFSRWYDNEPLEDGRNRKFDISTSVIAWAPFPAPYRGGDSE